MCNCRNHLNSEVSAPTFNIASSVAVAPLPAWPIRLCSRSLSVSEYAEFLYKCLATPLESSLSPDTHNLAILTTPFHFPPHLLHPAELN